DAELLPKLSRAASIELNQATSCMARIVARLALEREFGEKWDGLPAVGWSAGQITTDLRRLPSQIDSGLQTGPTLRKPIRTMIHAYAAHEPHGKLSRFDFDPGPLRDEQVEIKVSHCGICHSDLSMIDNEWMQSKYPLVPGHEV